MDPTIAMVLLTIVIMTIAICITMFNVMTDHNRLDSKDKAKVEDTKVELEKIKLQLTFAGAAEDRNRK